LDYLRVRQQSKVITRKILAPDPSPKLAHLTRRDRAAGIILKGLLPADLPDPDPIPCPEKAMSPSDKDLGMDRDDSRRDFLNGVALVADSLALPESARRAEEATAPSPDHYPPARPGLRGSHPGSFEAAHQLRDTHNRIRGTPMFMYHSFD
jgi:hypothetical protein